MRPAWRPRPHALVLLLGASLAVGLLAAPFGVSLQRSLWSEYGRMGGLIDAAHWLALAVMLTAMLRTGAAWRRFLTVHLGAGLALAVLAIARHLGGGPDGAGWWWIEPHWPRIQATTANPIFLGAYMQGIALLAAGFLIRSFAGAAAKGPGVLAARLFQALTAGAALWALALSGSMGALAGLAAGTGVAALFYAGFGPGRTGRRAGLATLLALGFAAAALAGVLVLRPSDAPPSSLSGAPVLARAADPARIASTLGKRLDNWRAGLAAVAERPLAGWGPENYMVAVARHDRAAAATNRARDRAHNMALEKAATEGMAGLLAWLALWAATLAAAWRAARRLPPPDAALALFAGAALFGWLVQSLTAFYSGSVWLQHIVLLAFLAHLGGHLPTPAGSDGPRAARLPEATRRTAANIAAAAGRTLRPPAVRVALALVAAAPAAASLATLPAIHAGAAALHRAETAGPFMAELRRAIGAFGPLATFPRILLIENAADNWGVIHAHDPARALRLLAWAEAEARPALAAEPENWQLRHALAKLYAAAATHPRYRDEARRWHALAREAAPWQDPLMPGKPGGRGSGR